MTIEIKQLVIRAVADARREKAESSTESAPGLRREAHGDDVSESRESLVAACTREVLRRLERARER